MPLSVQYSKYSAIRLRLVVFLREIHGASGHGILRFEKERQTDHIPPCVPPRDHGAVLVELPEVRGGRGGRGAGAAQLCSARRHVHVLPALGPGAQVPEVFVLEEICHEDAADSVRVDASLLRPYTFLTAMPIRLRIYLLHLHQYNYFSLSLYQFLLQELQKQEKYREGTQGRTRKNQEWSQ